MSPMGKKKCSYSGMHKKGLISPTPAMGGVEEVDPTTFEEKPLDPAESITGKNVFVPQYKVKSNPKYFKKGNSKSKNQRIRG